LNKNLEIYIFSKKYLNRVYVIVYNKNKMVRASSKTSAPVTPVTPVIDTASASVPVVVEKKEKVSRPKKATPVVETQAPVVPVTVTDVVVPTTDNVDVANEDGLVDKSTVAGALLAEIAEFNKNFQAWNNYGNVLKLNIKNIAKYSSRVSKNADKSSKRKKNAKTRPSGFEKPTPISDELAVFFGKELGSLMARTEVSKQIHEYVMTQKLQNEKNRRIIHPDPKLKQLLNVNNDELTYFNLQKYLKFHFKKDVVVAKA
jgi:chromatin remodeling complex protein RSC6